MNNTVRSTVDFNKVKEIIERDQSDWKDSRKRNREDEISSSSGEEIENKHTEIREDILIGPIPAKTENSSFLWKAKARGRGSVGSNCLDQYFGQVDSKGNQVQQNEETKEFLKVTSKNEKKEKKSKKEKKEKKRKKEKKKKEK